MLQFEAKIVVSLYYYLLLFELAIKTIPIIMVGSQRIKEYIPALLTSGLNAGP
jgi:hypothetical protein